MHDICEGPKRENGILELPIFTGKNGIHALGLAFFGQKTIGNGIKIEQDSHKAMGFVHLENRI